MLHQKSRRTRAPRSTDVSGRRQPPYVDRCAGGNSKNQWRANPCKWSLIATKAGARRAGAFFAELFLFAGPLVLACSLLAVLQVGTYVALIASGILGSALSLLVGYSLHRLLGPKVPAACQLVCARSIPPPARLSKELT